MAIGGRSIEGSNGSGTGKHQISTKRWVGYVSCAQTQSALRSFARTWYKHITHAVRA